MRLGYDDLEKYGSGDLKEFFKLENDNDSAVIRILVERFEDIQIVAYHEVVGDEGKNKKISCLRHPDEPVDTCPLCEIGSKIRKSGFFEFLVYEQDNDKNFTGDTSVQIFEKSKTFIDKVRSTATRYASDKALMDVMFEIVRNGKKGDKRTTYELYKLEEDIPIPESVLETETFDPIGSLVLEYGFDEMGNLIDTGQILLKDDVSRNVVSRGDYRSNQNVSGPTSVRSRTPERTPERTRGSRRPTRLWELHF